MSTSPGSSNRRSSTRQSPSTHRRPAWLTPYIPSIEATVALLQPHLEAVVHDIKTDRIAAIWNAFSDRSVGDPSLLDELPAYDEKVAVLGPYEKVSLDGRRLTSVSSILVDHAGTHRGLLCINFDRSPFDDVIGLLSGFVSPVVERPQELFDRDWREQIALAVDEICKDRRLRRDHLNRDARLELVAALDGQGLFETRNAAQHVAHALGVSRATIYTLLKEVRS